MTVLGVAGGLALALACGGPKYPACDGDDQCNVEGHKGVCVDHKCVDCRDDGACGAGAKCKEGTCVKAPPPAPQPAPVSAKPAVECDDEHPCAGAGEKCQNGHCVGPPPGGPGCRDFPAPGFAYESSELDEASRQTLQRLATCVASGSLKGHRLLLTGHCDPRGENEYNMGLGADRAERVRTFLVGLGVDGSAITTSSRGKLDAVGTDETTWAKDRRVDIEVR